MDYLQKFKEKCGVDDKFCEKTIEITNKLVEFGYINKLQVKNLYKKLYENVDIVLFGKDSSLDFKTGYFDAVRKELYLQNIDNNESFYLRMLYIFTTTKISENAYNVGYSTASLGRTNYKIEYKNFSVNRAIVSNLVCRLLYTAPTALSIHPTYRTYENTFLGNKISADNDIYFLEGRLITELCFILNSNEEDLYINLFNSDPNKFLEKFLKKNKFKNYDETLELLDTISRLNSNYNKLCFLNKILDENYINIKKNVLNKENLAKYKDEEVKIKMAIKSTLLKLDNKDSDDDTLEDIDIDHSLSERINKFEENILQKTYEFQTMLVKILINTKSIYKNIDYAVKLKKLQNILVTENEVLNNELYNLIRTNLINSYESNTSNLIEKIKYSLVHHTLDKQKFISSYKDLSFKKLDIVNLGNSSLVAYELENTFIQLISIENVNLNIKNIHNNVKELPLSNLGYLLNNATNQVSTERIEKLYTLIKDTIKDESPLVQINDIYISEYNDSTLIIVPFKETYKIFEAKNVYHKDLDIEIKEIALSESIYIFSDPAKMPALYAEDSKNIFKRILNILTITFWC